jgi:hypothetical protein
MLPIFEQSTSGSRGLNRREWLRVGGLNALGLSLPTLLAADARGKVGSTDDPTFGRAKNVIYLYMSGGAPQHETFDPKPDAPAEVRGSFRPIHTNVPGIDFCELLPRTARIADKLAVCRAMSTDDNTHSTSGYWVLTGFKYRGSNAREIHPTDWPHIGSVVKMLKPSESVPFSFAWLPEPIVANPGVLISGQTGGFLGPRWDPERFTCDPQSEKFVVKEFQLPGDLSPLRLSSRATLLEQVDRHFRREEQAASTREYGRLQQEALGVLTTGKARTAFAIDQEPDALRDRYGRGKWGQSVLLARRLIEAGVRFVNVQWPREPGDLSSGAPLWDTHSNNDKRLKSVLCPQFDVGFSALIEDLQTRGLLDETLVVAVGEFGRTPKFNGNAGRDHWGPVFSFALAGAGISGGQVYGSSDAKGAYPHSGRILPQELSATIFHLLGIGHNATMLDRNGRPTHICNGEPLYHLLGSNPATSRRRPATGEVGPIPDFRPIHLPKTG